MEVRTISCSKKIKAELAINVDTIEYKTSSLHANKEVFERPFTISVGDGSNYQGKIIIMKNTAIKSVLACYVYDVKSLTGNVSMIISKRKIISEYCTTTDSGKIPNAKLLEAKLGEEPITFLKGNFTITFEPMVEKLVKESLLNSFSLLKQDQLEGPTDVRLVVQGKEFEFNMACLALISPMFKNMFQFNTSGDKKIPITNDLTTVQIMETFQKILVQKCLKPQEITVALYKFANFYDIQPLVKFCGDHLGSKINKENVFEIAMAADLVDDVGLLKKVAQFLMVNPGIDMKNFRKTNPGVGDKLMAELFLSMRK